MGERAVHVAPPPCASGTRAPQALNAACAWSSRSDPVAVEAVSGVIVVVMGAVSPTATIHV